MIELLTGTVYDRLQEQILLTVGPMTISLFMPRRVLVGLAHGETITLQTVWVWRETTGPQLFGFTDLVDKISFQLLLTAPGIGPKGALALIHQMTGSAVLKALAEGNDHLIAQTPGLGKKTAAKLIVELKEKARKASVHTTTPSLPQEAKDAIAALVQLGRAEQAIYEKVQEGVAQGVQGTAELIRYALSPAESR